MNAAPLVTIAAVVALGGGGAFIMLQPSEEEKFLAMCDEVMKGRLKAPTTYVRVRSTKLSTGKATRDQFFGLTTAEAKTYARANPPRTSEAKKAQETLDEIFATGDWFYTSSWVEYDAANSYGTPIRGAFECSIKAPQEELKVEPYSSVAVDGFDRLNWSMYQLWQAQQ